MITADQITIGKTEVAHGYYTIIDSDKLNFNDIIKDHLNHELILKSHNEGYIKMHSGETIAIVLEIVSRNEQEGYDGARLGKTRDFGTHFDIFGCSWVIDVSTLTINGTRNKIMKFSFSLPLRTRYPDDTTIEQGIKEHLDYSVTRLNNELNALSEFLDHYIERIK